jgi:hypothetical protein
VHSEPGAAARDQPDLVVEPQVDLLLLRDKALSNGDHRLADRQLNA